MNFLQKIQNQSVYVKKIILWTIVIIVATGLFAWWLRSSWSKIKLFPAGEFKGKIDFPSWNGEKEKFQEQMQEIKLPDVSEEDLKKLEEELQRGESK